MQSSCDRDTKREKGVHHDDLLHARRLSNALIDVGQRDMWSIVNEGIVQVGDDITLVDETLTS